MGIFNRAVQCWESWVHVLKASKDSGSDDAQEQANNVEDGGRPEQVVEVDDILATADIDVFVVPTSDLHPVATVVEVTAEAGVAPDARCAEFTAEVRAVNLLSFLLGCLGNIMAPVSIEWFQIPQILESNAVLQVTSSRRYRGQCVWQQRPRQLWHNKKLQSHQS